MNDKMRIVLGFALAPLASGVLQTVATQSLSSFSIVIFSYPMALLFGIPGYFIARRLGWTSLRAVALSGAGLGLLASLLVNFYFDSHKHGLDAVIAGVVLCATHGMAVAALFWFIALRRSQ